MKHLYHLFIVVCVMSAPMSLFKAMAQSTPQDPAFAGIEVTFDKDDLLNAMTDDERTDFLEMREKLRQLKKAAKNSGLDPAVREVSASAFRTTREKFEEEFGVYRGFNGKTVLVYGHPSPSKKEIMTIVLSGGMLQPHWKREDSGAVVGLSTRPTFETSGIPAGPEVRAKVKGQFGKNRPHSSGESLNPEQHCRKHAGPPSSQGLKCKCNPPEQEIMGLPSCWWYK